MAAGIEQIFYFCLPLKIGRHGYFLLWSYIFKKSKVKISADAEFLLLSHKIEDTSAFGMFHAP